MKRSRHTFLISGLLFLAAGAATFADPVQNSDIDWDNQPPSRIHQKLWEAKLQSRSNAEQALQLKSLEAAGTQTNYDVRFYDIDLRVDDTTEILTGVVKFIADAAEPLVTQVEVDLYSNMTIDSIVNGAASLTFSRAGNVVTVNLDKAYALGEQFEFNFYYHGHPIEGGFQAFAFDWRSGVRVITSLSEPYLARTWWPCKDRMDDKADSFYMSITVDTAFYCASNGLIQSVDTTGNAHTYHYRVEYPMASYLFSVAISPYAVWEDTWYYNGGADSMPIIHAVYPDVYAYSLSHYDVTPEVLTVLSNAFGEYPFAKEKYGHANFLWGGGMEHQTMTSMTGGSFGFSLPVVVHEAAHQWWGDMITCESWSHIWLNEGWASYAEAVYYLETGGWAAYHSYMNGMAYSGGGTIYVYDTTSVWNIFSGIVYDKGAWVCHMLRGILGETPFNAGVSAYYNSVHQHGSATTEDFRDVFEQATGVELDWFFQDWIYGTYRPDYAMSYWEEPSSKSSGYDLFVHIRQKQATSPTVFHMPIDLYFDYGSGGDTVVVWDDERAKTFKFNNAQSVTGIELDPSDWILKYRSYEGWKMHIVTMPEEVSDGEQVIEYNDTLETRGGSGNFAFSITSGNLPTGFNLDNQGVISGTTIDTGSFTFTVNVYDQSLLYTDSSAFSITISPLSGGIPGDFDLSFELNISDLTALVDFMFNAGPAPVLPNLADVDASCDINISDLTDMVDFLFGGGSALQMGCVN